MGASGLFLGSTFPPPRNAWRGVIFLSISLLVHIFLILAIRAPTISFSTSKQNPLTVYIVAPPIAKQFRIPDKTLPSKHDIPSTLAITPEPIAAPLIAVQPDTPASSVTANDLNLQQLLNGAHSAAQTYARRTEQHDELLKKERSNTPIGSLEEYLNLKQPHKEMRRSDGTIKVITDAGMVWCFKPAPFFASGDIEKNVFIAMSCN